MQLKSKGLSKALHQKTPFQDESLKRFHDDNDWWVMVMNMNMKDDNEDNDDAGGGGSGSNISCLPNFSVSD